TLTSLISSALCPCPPPPRHLHPFPPRRSSDLPRRVPAHPARAAGRHHGPVRARQRAAGGADVPCQRLGRAVRHAARCRARTGPRSEEHTSELQSRENLVCRLLLEKKNREELTS